MKLDSFFKVLSAAMLLVACAKPKDDNASVNTGNYTIWAKSDLGFGKISVYIDNAFSGTISHYHAQGITCGSGDVNIKKSEGTYAFSAKGETGGNWNGTISFENGQCKTLELTGTNPGTSGCNYNMTGTWVRQNDGGCTNCSGMQIVFSGGQGVIQNVSSNNSQKFYTGQVKWKNFNPSNCTMDDLFMPNPAYNNVQISFTNSTTLNIGSIVYKKQ